MISRSKGITRIWSELIFENQHPVDYFDIKSFNIYPTENKVAYFDYFFDELVRNERPHNIENLNLVDILEYFGLTP